MDKIVESLWQRDEHAIESMEKEYGTVCRRILSRFLNNVQDAEEALNDVWLHIWNSIPPAKPRYMRAYVAKTARNTALHYIEQAHAQKRSAIHVLLDELSECLPDQSYQIQMENQALKDCLNQFITSIHGDEHQFFLERYYFGERISDIAANHQCTENRVSVTLFRTRKKLHDLLQKEGHLK